MVRTWREGKDNARNPENSELRARFYQRLLLFPFGTGRGGLGSLGLQHALLEFIDAPRGIDEFLRAGVKGMADVANAQQNNGAGGAGLDDVATGATDFRFLIFRMNVSFHKRRENLPVNRALTSANLGWAPGRTHFYRRPGFQFRSAAVQVRVRLFPGFPRFREPLARS